MRNATAPALWLGMFALLACGSPRRPPPRVDDPAAIARLRSASAKLEEVRREHTKLEQVQRERNSMEMVVPVHVERPGSQLDTVIPDPSSRLLRWPLTPTDHPDLSPRFAVAKFFAEPGVDVFELCRMGAHRRSLGPKLVDHVRYLRAWCSVTERDTDAALVAFAPLLTSLVPGLADAVRIDVANVLINEGDAARASRLVAQHGLLDLAILDRLAAMYLDLGKEHDAEIINTLALGHDDATDPMRQCQRAGRRVVMDPAAFRIPLFDRKELLDVRPKTSACVRLENELACWLRPATSCAAYFDDQKLPTETQPLLTIHLRWPGMPETFEIWFGLYQSARRVFPSPLAYAYALHALDGASKSTVCRDRISLRMIHDEIAKVRDDSKLPPELKSFAMRLVDTGDVECAP